MEFPGYTIVGEIGRGGMATVYRARQNMLDREVALKVLLPVLAADTANAQRFLQEARMLASLEHPHVVPVYDVGVTPGGAYYFSMQLLENGDFTSRLHRGVSEPELVRVLSAVADALAWAHARGYVHRDVTPANILFDADDKPRLTDFGIARALAATSRITASGLSVGTSHYMSPEQARGSEVDPRSDIYSLGVVCYEALTGRPPFDGEDGFAVAYAHVHEPVPPLPPALAKWQPLIDRCMAKRPEDRFQDCGQFIATLRRIAFASHTSSGQRVAAISDETPTVRVLRRQPPGVTSDEQAIVPSGPAAAAGSGATNGGRRRLGALGAAAGVAILVLAALLVWQPWGGREAGGELAVAQTAPIAAPAEPGPSQAPPGPGEGEPAVDGEGAPDPGPGADALARDEGLLPDDHRALEDLEASVEAAAEHLVLDPVPVLLELAERDLQERRYTSPAGDNALERYLLVRRMDRHNRSARAGIERVAAAYLALADERAGDEEDLPIWLAHLERAEELAARFEVPSVTEGVRTRRAARAEQLLETARAAVLAWDRDQAMQLFAEALELVPDSAAVRKEMQVAERIGRDGFRFRDPLASGDGPEMIIVNGLAFSITPVTVGEFKRYWQAVGAQRFAADPPLCRDRESTFRASRKRNFLEPGFQQGDDHPVVCITAAMADDYAHWLAQGSGQAYRVPRNAELQAAGMGVAEDCSANVRDAAYRAAFGGRDQLACDDGHAATSPVRAFAAATNGLHDLRGNVREWTVDCVGSACRERLVAGGSWASVRGEGGARAFSSDTGFNTIGFRVVRQVR